MAAQKYGPPLVGCALHISGAAYQKAVPFRTCREDAPAIAKPTNIVKKAKIKLNNWFWDEKKLPLPTTIHPHTITAGPPVVYNPSGNKTLASAFKNAHQTEEK